VEGVVFSKEEKARKRPMGWNPSVRVSLLEMGGVNLVMSGNNAVVIALVVRSLHLRYRRPAASMGSGSTVVA